MWKREQEREDCGHAACRNWYVVCVRGRGAGRQLQIEPLMEEERERIKLPLVSFDYVFSTQENADTFPILIRRDDGQSQTRVACCERKDSFPHLIPLLVDWRILLEDENGPSMKVFQEARIHSCVEVAVRETKRQHRILRISTGYDPSMRITDEVSLFN